MAKVWQSVVLLLGVWATIQALFSTPAAAQLSPSFYNKTCPQLYAIVGKGVHTAILNETRIAASLLRLHFHDCFVQGCDASVLLDATATNGSEKDALPNLNSLRGYSTIDTIKTAVESACPNVVSCADIVTLAAFFSVILSGGPIWWVPLGRRDSFFSNVNLTSNLPGPFLNVSGLKDKFSIQNLNTQDLVALSGGHTIGLARCTSFNTRLFNFLGSGSPDPALNATLLKALVQTCPNGGNGNVTTSLDISTPNAFDNLYFKNLLLSDGILNSDQQLFSGGNATDTKALVKLYAANQTRFFLDFATSMTKMGNLNTLTGKAGEVRKNCHVRNPVSSPVVVEEESTSETPLEKIFDGAEIVTEGAMEFFSDVLTKVVKEIAQEELRRLVENPVGKEHSSI